MAVTGAQMIDRVCAEAGMNVAAASTDRALALSYINQALSNCALEAEINTPATPATVSLTQGTARYDLTVAPFAVSGLISIDEITLTDGAQTAILLEQRTFSDILDMQQGAVQAQATPYCYAVEYPAINFYPTPSSSTTLSITYAATPSSIADSATVVTVIPDAFLWGVLVEFAIARGMRYKKQAEWVRHEQAYMSDKISGMPALRRWISRMGGRHRPNSGDHVTPLLVPSQDLGPFS